MQAAGAQGLDLGGVGLHREEHDFLAGRFFKVLEEAIPDFAVERGVLDRRVGEDERRRIDDLFGVARRVGDQVAVAVAIGLVEIAARAILRERAGAKADCEGDGRENSNVSGHFPLVANRGRAVDRVKPLIFLELSQGHGEGNAGRIRHCRPSRIWDGNKVE